MDCMKPYPLILLLCLSAFSGMAQTESPFTRFGRISLADLQKKAYAIDSNAHAVVLSDVGASEFEGNNKGWFSVLNTRHKVTHVLSKNGYEEASVEIPLYQDGDSEEKLRSLKAVTYNLENGKIVETRLARSAVFKEKVNKNKWVYKFTFPNVREGSIIEFEYKVATDYIANLDPWIFQGSAPRIWSEYNFKMPDFFSYNLLSRGYLKLDINERKETTGHFVIREAGDGGGRTQTYSFSANVTAFRWAMRNVPRMVEESFTSSIANHLSRLEFQLSAQRAPLVEKDFRGNWNSMAKDLLESEYFGARLRAASGSVEDELKTVALQTSGLEKARKIYQYIRDNFVSTGNDGFYVGTPLKSVFKARKGTVAEINMLLLQLLRSAGFEADPVILSTRSHGYALESSPMTTNFNYLVVVLKNDGQSHYLDASDPLLGFGKLQPFCFNGHARVANEQILPVYLSADSVMETKVTQLIMVNNDKGEWVGSMNQRPGYYESYGIRGKMKESGKEAFFKEVQKNFGLDIAIGESRIDSLKQPDHPVALHYDFKVDHQDADILYINPLFGEGYKTNPFTAAERLYPVEMPYATDETIVVNMEVPKGYVIDELPKQALVKYDEEGKSFFEYRITSSGDQVSFRCRIKLARAFFTAGEYGLLREFFHLIVTKQNEQIVFKKKK